MNLNVIWSFIMAIISYVSFVASYAYSLIDLYFIFEKIPGMEPFIC